MKPARFEAAQLDARTAAEVKTVAPAQEPAPPAEA